MSDATENKKELDSYGVWVKHPATQDAGDSALATNVPGFTDADDAPLNTILPFSSSSDAVENKTKDFDIPSLDAATDKSLIEQIVAELTAIRKEIIDLKDKLGILKKHEEISDVTDSSSMGGFFGDLDEDETIALSGDELDNIMNTAEFSSDEEKPEEQSANAELETAASVDDMESDTTLSGDELGNIMNTADFADDKTQNDDGAQTSVETEITEEPVSENSGEHDDVHEELPDEISLPKTADIFIEPSQSDSVDSNDGPTDNIFIEPSPADFVDSGDEIIDDGNVLGTSASASDATPTAVESEATLDEPKASATESEEVSESVNVDDFFKAEPDADKSNMDSDIDYSSESEIKRESAVAESSTDESLPANLREEVKSVLLYMDRLLESLPEEKIVEFARSAQFATYKKLFSELGLS